MRIAAWVMVAAPAVLAACGHSEQPAPAPAAVTAPAPAAHTAPAPVAASAPAAASVAAAGSSAAPAAASAAGPERAGDVALAEGSVTDQAVDGSTRQLKDGDTVYPGDAFSIGDDSYLDLDLEDGGRILLRPDTSFQIQEYHFDPDAHPEAGQTELLAVSQQKPESAFFKLVKGGLRAVDGLIGQSHPQNYGVVTPVATIGVRGTAFDVRYCGDDCKDEADTSGAPQNGLYTAVSEGSIGVKNDSGETVTKAGEYSYVASRHVAVQHLAAAPRALRHMALPEKFKARAQKTRGQIHVRRQARRQQVLQQRRQKLEPKPKPAAEQAEKGKAAGGKAQAPTPAERREQRLQERRERNALPAGEKRGQGQGRAEPRENPRQGGRAAAEARQPPGNAAGQSRREQRQEQVKQRREERAAGKKPQPEAAANPQAGREKPAEKPECKDKKRKRGKDKDKDKDKCGGG